MFNYSRSPFILLVMSFQSEARERAAMEEARKAEKKAENDSWICLNNLYLNVESGKKRLSRRVGNDLMILLDMAYERGDPMREYWEGEFQKLPGWDKW